MIKRYPAVVLGMYETGLGVARSLGKEGIRVYGIDYKKDIGFYSRFVRPSICPDPLTSENDFIDFLIEFSLKGKEKPVLFITSDNFILTISRNREKLSPYYCFNFPPDHLLKTIFNKYLQYELVKNTGVNVPVTVVPESEEQLNQLSGTLSYPLIIKGMNVSDWRKKISSSVKGYTAKDPGELLGKCLPILRKSVKLIIQEIIEGPDTNHYKYCAYYSSEGKPELEFTLRKIRQNPVHFGVGSVVESIEFTELSQAGNHLFQSIGYRGVGSAEFKRDNKDGRLKLIEINPRYWQQNSLATKCGMNFPLTDYLECTGQHPAPQSTFIRGIKWINIYLDFGSYLQYKKEKSISFSYWLKSLKGEKVFSDFSWSDILPGFYELFITKKFLKVFSFLLNNSKKHG